MEVEFGNDSLRMWVITTIFNSEITLAFIFIFQIYSCTNHFKAIKTFAFIAAISINTVMTGTDAIDFIAPEYIILTWKIYAFLIKLITHLFLRKYRFLFYKHLGSLLPRKYFTFLLIKHLAFYLDNKFDND